MNGSLIAAVALSLVSAVAYASAAVAQERLATRTPAGTRIRTLLGRGAWWWSVGLNATGAALHVAALTYGSLTVVQPLGALTLVAAVPLGARRAGRQVSRGEWRGTAFTLVGLAVILLTAAGTAPTDTLSLPQALGVAGVALALVALLTRSRSGGRPGLGFATASGITSGVASALTQTVTVAATGGGSHAMPIWQVGGVALLVAVFASGGLLLSQTAYRGGLGAPLAVLTLANPVAASAVGLALLGERLQGGALGIVAAAAGAVAAARGVVLLTRTTPPATPESPVTAAPVAASAVPAPSSPAVRRSGPAPARTPAPAKEPTTDACPGTDPVRTGPESASPPAEDVWPVQPPASVVRPRMARSGANGTAVSGVPAQAPEPWRPPAAAPRAARLAEPGGTVWAVPAPVPLLPGSFAAVELPRPARTTAVSVPDSGKRPRRRLRRHRA